MLNNGAGSGDDVDGRPRGNTIGGARSLEEALSFMTSKEKSLPEDDGGGVVEKVCVTRNRDMKSIEPERLSLPRSPVLEHSSCDDHRRTREAA